MKILIAVDGSEYTKRMLAYLAAHDEWPGAQNDFTVVHALPAVPHRAAAFVGIETVRKFYEEDAEVVFRPIRAFMQQQGIDAKFVHTVGNPADSIVSLADEGKFDLLIMGSRGHGEIVNLVLGSVAAKVAARCATPVLLVR